MTAVNTLSRVLTLDLLRGYFLLVIILNHLHFYPSGLEWITGQSFLYASTAEGFFLLSGIVLGMVRGAKLLDKPFSIAAKLLLKRSFQLYVTSVILVILFTLIGWLFINNPGLKYGILEPVGAIGELVWKAVTFQYLYGWADYLRLYAIFIFLSPLALWLLRKGQWVILLLASVIIWALYPFSPFPTGEFSQPISWQLIFFGGFTIGFYWNQIRSWWHAQTALAKRSVTAIVFSMTAVTLIFNILIVFGDGLPGIGPALAMLDNTLSPFFNKDQLPLPRLALFALWFSALYLLFARFQTSIVRFAGWLLLPFGTNSLYVYTIQAFVLFGTLLIVNEPSRYWFVNLAISLIVIAVVYTAVRTKFLMKIIPR
jgi:hypothetical protein